MSHDAVALIEVVCTGNICRSPYAEALLRAAAADRLDDPALVVVRSSGVRGLEGHPASESTVLEAARRDLDLTDHAGARWTEERIQEADLVLTMSVSHRAHLAEQVRGASARTFTIRELVRLLSHARPVPHDQPRQRVANVAAAAHAARPLAPRPREPEDVDDPYGGPPEGYARMAAQLDRLVLALADDLFGPLPDVDGRLFG